MSLLISAFILCNCFLAAHSESNHQECGIRYAVNRHKPVISHGFEAKHSEYPWHVALYRQYSPTQEPEYICGGTIIHQLLILTAAHCVYNETSFSLNNANFTVVAGKCNRPWGYRDPDEQIFKITEIRLPETYVGLPNRYADDIAVLALNDSIKFSSTIMPVCVDWSLEYLSNKSMVLGMVVGWGYTQNGSLSNELMVAKLNYFNFTSCRERVEDSGFSSFLTSDKFCAGVDNGTGVEQGDSGGGFVVPRSSTENIERYYLYGIVSTKDTWTNRTAAFTNVNIHINWINSTIESLMKLGYCTPLASGEVELIDCSNNGTLISCEEPSKRGTKGKIRCRSSYHEIPPHKMLADTECFENRTWSPFEDSCLACGIRDIALTYAEKQRPEPWHVGIYSGSTQIRYICGGTIFHPRAVLTAAHCVHGQINVSFHAVIGKRECSWSSQEYREQRFQVSKIFVKATFEGIKGIPFYMDDIAILVLNDTVKLSRYVMPACIDWSGKLQLHRNPLISGLSMGCDQSDGALKVNRLRILDWKICSVVSQFLPLAEDKICATSDDGTAADLGTGYSGGSFTYPKYNENNGDQINYLYGIISHKTNNIFKFTDVMYHLDWIKNILVSDIIKS